MKKKPQLSQVFLRAAELVDKEEEIFSCDAISQAQGAPDLGYSTHAHSLFYSLYRPNQNAAFTFMSREDGTVLCAEISRTEAKARRIIALLFAAEIAKSEGL
jgi:hypothetical protein